MNMIWLSITSLLSVTPLICGQNIDRSHIRVFPAANQSIAGVFQVSHLSDLDQPEYAFNASEARRLCLSLGLNIASKAQVLQALTRGLETCRFGWIDEHFAVIPRRKALSNCGQSQTGLVPWRAPVTKKFDVFCFNESDVATKLKDITTDSPLNSTEHSGQTLSPSYSTHILHSTSSSSTPKIIDSEVEPARFVGSAQGSTGAKAIIITSSCALLLIAVIILAYIKMRRSRSDMKQQQEYIQTEEGREMFVTNAKETKKAAEEEED